MNISDQIKKSLNFIKFKGIDGVVSTVRYKMSGPGLSYNGWYKETHEPDEEALTVQRETEFAYAPKISILVSVYMTPEFFLRAMIESVQKQTYSNWELCIVDGSQAPDESRQEEEQPHGQRSAEELHDALNGKSFPHIEHLPISQLDTCRGRGVVREQHRPAFCITPQSL